MSLTTEISDGLTSICTAIKADRAARGNLADLTTATKSTIVGALNELAASIGGAGATINDASASTTSVYSSSKTQSVADAAAAAIVSDASASTSTAYSSQKVTDLIATAVSGILGGAPAALDTLKELADALGDDGSFATTITAALGNRLRFDAVQTLTSGQKTQGQSNLDVYGKSDIGDPTTDFVAVVTAGLA